MDKQLIIVIIRQTGCGGQEAGKLIADRMGIPCLDKKLIDDIIDASFDDPETFKKYDGKPANHMLSRRVGEFSNSIEEYAANRIFEMIKNEADNGESFVAIGRCAEWITRDNKNVFSVFLYGDEKTRAENTAREKNISIKKAAEYNRTKDKKRKAYHNYYCDTKWGHPETYDISVDCGKYGPRKTADMVIESIKILLGK